MHVILFKKTQKVGKKPTGLKNLRQTEVKIKIQCIQLQVVVYLSINTHIIHLVLMIQLTFSSLFSNSSFLASVVLCSAA